MNRYGIEVNLKNSPELDPVFYPLQRFNDAFLADARKKARANEERIVQDAMAEAGRIVDNANREAELSKQKVANEVKEEIVSVAGAMAGKLVAASLDEETQNKLLDDTLKEMGDDTWLS